VYLLRCLLAGSFVRLFYFVLHARLFACLLLLSRLIIRKHSFFIARSDWGGGDGGGGGSVLIYLRIRTYLFT